MCVPPDPLFLQSDSKIDRTIAFRKNFIFSRAISFCFSCLKLATLTGYLRGRRPTCFSLQSAALYAVCVNILMARAYKSALCKYGFAEAWLFTKLRFVRTASKIAARAKKKVADKGRAKRG